MEGAELVLMRSVTISDVSSNGGRMSFTQVSSNVLKNMFNNITQEERTSGTTKYRKFFFRNKNASNETAVNSRIWISQRSLGGDYYRLKAGTDSDIQSEADDYSDWMGTGYLTQPLATDATTMTALFDAATGVYNGSLIRLCDSSGGEEFLTVKASGGISWLGNTATIITTAGARSIYPASQNSLVSGVVDLGDIVAATSAWAETSVSGTYDEVTYPVVVNNIGTVSDTWTLTFTSASAFTVTGANTGSVGSGSILSDFQPVNPSVGTGDYYFQIYASGWGGTFVAGDTITFVTTYSAKGIWIKEVVPAGTVSCTQNITKFKLYSEGA
jgi:hypothetical protein